MNRTGSVIRQGEIKFSVDLLGKKRRDQVLDDWSLMEGEKVGNSWLALLEGPITPVNPIATIIWQVASMDASASEFVLCAKLALEKSWLPITVKIFW